MKNKKNVGRIEFILLIALMTSLLAFSVDTILPALAIISEELGETNPNNRQLIITSIFAGMALGQMLFGPLSDSIGRKLSIYWGMLIFIIGSIFCILATDFWWLLFGRFMQGFGASAGRIVTMAIVRDLYSGRKMASTMSFVMAVFILVPVVAPAFGQLMLAFLDWRMLFVVFVIFSAILTLWFGMRQPETLAIENRVAFSIIQISKTLLSIIKNPIILGYSIISGMIFGAFLGYLLLSQQILQQQYDLGWQFAIYFGGFALAISISAVVNGSLVERLGMHFLTKIALISCFVISSIFVIISLYYLGHPPLWLLSIALVTVLFFMGLLFGNFNALAMEPLEKSIGIGVALIGSLSLIISVIIGTIIGASYDNSVTPMLVGFALFSLLAWILMYFTEAQRVNL
jgi:DHA1 family bicyclomycin/chloramphenicol resistance-like MFS transporter